MKIVKKIQLKIVIFTALKNRSKLHGRVFVMMFLDMQTVPYDQSVCMPNLRRYKADFSLC